MALGHAPAVAAQSAPVTMGETAMLGTTDSGNANVLVAQQTACSQNATIQSLSFYVGTAPVPFASSVYGLLTGR